LDLGEASVIQLALDLSIQTVCIDERAGRRIARLSGLRVTGLLGILIKAKNAGFQIRIAEAIARMRQHGIWLSERVVADALRQAGEDPM
jgi:predicted nucleic acid-binding protein